MNKSDLIAAIAAKTNETKKDAEATLNAFIEVVTESLAAAASTYNRVIPAFSSI